MMHDQYWWTDMHQHIVAYVRKCEICDWIMYSFNTLTPQL